MDTITYLDEIWLPIVGYESNYAVSNYGRIRRVSHSRIKQCGDLLAPGFQTNGYAIISLSLEGHVKTWLIHRLVFQTFKGHIPQHYHINHIDGNKHNNHISNLECVTPGQNEQHSYDILGKRAPYGSQHYSAKLNEALVLCLRQAFASGQSYSSLSREYGVDLQTVRRAIRGETWKHVS